MRSISRVNHTNYQARSVGSRCKKVNLQYCPYVRLDLSFMPAMSIQLKLRDLSLHFKDGWGGGKGKFGCKDRRGRGSKHLSLQCKDREFPKDFDVIPYQHTPLQKRTNMLVILNKF